jgi:hypothetical protein
VRCPGGRPAGRRRPSMLMSELSKYTSSYA